MALRQFILASGTYIKFTKCFVSSRCRSTEPTSSSLSHASKFLSSDFSLSAEWAGRINQLSNEELGGDDFEWISGVQKKYSSGGKASAVDLDMACTVSTQFNQIDDLLDLCYKFRHTDAATDLFPSTEYAMYRLFLDFHDTDNFLKVLNDTINYGLFMNEHCCCLYLDDFLASGNLQCAAKIAIYAMQQELFSWPILNFLATNALLRWVELAPSERVFDEHVHTIKPETLEEETSFNEENVRLFRYPYLKNPFWDGHFDLSQPDQLVGKSLEWFSWHLKLPDDNNRNLILIKSINFIGLAFQRKWEQLRAQLETLLKNVEPSEQEVLCAALKITKTLFEANEPSEQEGKNNTEKKEENDHEEQEGLKVLVEQKIKELGGDENGPKLSTLLTMAFKPFCKEEERALMEQQRKLFTEWNTHRKEFIRSQAERAEIMARLNEIRKRRKELEEERQLLFFFENRVRLEDEARERDEVVKELTVMKKKGDLTEEEYAQGMFHLARKLKEGQTAKQALHDIAESELITQIKEKAKKAAILPDGGR